MRLWATRWVWRGGRLLCGERWRSANTRMYSKARETVQVRHLAGYILCFVHMPHSLAYHTFKTDVLIFRLKWLKHPGIAQDVKWRSPLGRRGVGKSQATSDVDIAQRLICQQVLEKASPFISCTQNLIKKYAVIDSSYTFLFKKIALNINWCTKMPVINTILTGSWLQIRWSKPVSSYTN